MVVAAMGTWAIVLLGAGWSAMHTLDADLAHCKHLLSDGSWDAQGVLEKAIARHPADDLLELLAAREAVKRRDPSAIHHLNRALRLHPANWQGHHMAGRILGDMHRPAQAAIEYRLALEHGMRYYLEEILQVVGSHVIDAVPQNQQALLSLARFLYTTGNRPDLADRACERAETLPESDVEQVARARVELALASAPKPLVLNAVDRLLERKPGAHGYATAGKALAQLHETARLRAALEAGMKQHPTDHVLRLLGARLLIEHGELAAARRMLKDMSDGTATLDDHRQAEELYALIAEKNGDTESAFVAHARAHMYERKMQENDIPHPLGLSH
jgi:tetratricopeptide (TPR) repeat protein